MKIKPQYKIRHIAGQSVTVDIGEPTVRLTRIITHNQASEWLWNELTDREFDTDSVADLIAAHYLVDRASALVDAARWVAMLDDAKLLDC